MALACCSLIILIINDDDKALQWCSVGVVNVGVLSSTYAHIFFITAYGQPKQVPICPHICPGTPRCPHICPGMPIDMLSAASRRCRPCTCLPMIFSSLCHSHPKLRFAYSHSPALALNFLVALAMLCPKMPLVSKGIILWNIWPMLHCSKYNIETTWMMPISTFCFYSTWWPTHPYKKL